MAEASSTEEGITLRIRYKSETLDGFAERYSADVGPGEIFVRTREPLAVGTPLKFDFTLRDGGPLLEGRGSVAWRREPDLSRPEPSGMAIRFDNLTPVGQKNLGQILAWKARAAEGAALAEIEATRTVPMNRPGPEHVRATTPYRTVIPDDPASALAAAGSITKLNRGNLTSPGRSKPASADTDLPEDAERTEIARMPPSFYYDAADDEARKKAAREEQARAEEARAEEVAAEDLVEEGDGGGPLDDLDDITSPRAEMPVHTLPPGGGGLGIPWKPPSAPVAGSLASALRPPGAGITSPGREAVDTVGRGREKRDTLGFGAAPTPVTVDSGSAALRPTRARVDTLGEDPGSGRPLSVDSPDASASFGAPAAGLPGWAAGDPVVHRPAGRGGTGKAWLVTALGAAAVIALGLWLVPRFMQPAAMPGAEVAATPAAEGEGSPPATGAGEPTAPATAAGNDSPTPAAAGGLAPVGQGEVPPAAGTATPAATAGGQPPPAADTVSPPAAPPAAAVTRPAAAAPAAAPAPPRRRVRNVRPRRVVADEAGPDPSAAPAAPATDPSAAPAFGSPATSAAGASAPPVAASDEEVYWLSVKSVPPGADVLIDGQVEGKTPFQRRIFDPERTYALSIRKLGFESVERSVSAADLWQKRGNVRTLTINARLMSSAIDPALPAAEVPGAARAPAATSEPAVPAPAVPPAAPAERKTNPFDEVPPPSPAPAPTP